MAGYRQGCPICERPDAERMPPAELRDTFRVVCSSCGKFEVQVLLPKLVWDRLGEAVPDAAPHRPTGLYSPQKQTGL
jgi:hypothetical protein